jgi:hypothetical protein
MSVDLAAAERFMYTDARLLERHLFAVLLHDAPAAPALEALRAYRNPDGGFGHALEPDVRGPHSEPTSVLRALEVLVELGAGADPMVADAAGWLAAITAPDGGLPSVMPEAAQFPRAPWMVASEGGSQLTLAIAGELYAAGYDGGPWLARASEWCWAQLEDAETLGGYWIKFGLRFLDHVPDAERAEGVIDRIAPLLGDDGSVAVQGGTENERLRPLVLSPHRGARSRALFDGAQIEAELDALERGQQDDGGWTFDWLAWSPAQGVEWRGIVTLNALATLAAHGRIVR